MTDRYNSLTVILDRDIREDDCEVIMSAIRMIKGVLDVQGNVSDIDSAVAITRVRREMQEKIYQALNNYI